MTEGEDVTLNITLTTDDDCIPILEIGNILSRIQEMAWHLGSFIEGREYRGQGDYPKDIRDKYALMVTDIKRGSVEAEISSSPLWCYPTLEDGKYEHPGNRVLGGMGDVFQYAMMKDADGLHRMIPDVNYHNRIVTDLRNIIPHQTGHVLEIGVTSGDIYRLSEEQWRNASGLYTEKRRGQAVEEQYGVLADLRVDNGYRILIERMGPTIKADYPPDLLDGIKHLLGRPVIISGTAIRDEGSDRIQEFYLTQVEALEKMAMGSPFEGRETRTYTCKTEVDISIDYIQPTWSLSVDMLNAVGYDSEFDVAHRKLTEKIDFLWLEYVECPEEDLGETGLLLRQLLLEMFEVHGSIDHVSSE